MSRTADYTIQGFIYQFNLTLYKILLQDDNNAEITIEGPIEDIDINTPNGIEAIQCKYHETKEKFTLSTIYKPVLQMMKHFSLNSSQNTRYKLYAHFPNETVGNKKKLTEIEINKILSSQAKDNQSLIKELSSFTDISGFISRFEMEFGASLSDLEKTVIVSLAQEGFSTEDSEELFYPNAIHQIAELSIKHQESERIVKKIDFIEILKQKKKTAITRWTKELNSFEKLLKKRRDQMRENLNKNSRVRAIILDTEYIVDFDSKIVQFIEDFIDKYNCKIKLHNTPLFSLISNDNLINDVWKRLHAKNIIVERGLVANEFDVKNFLREPIKVIKDNKTEFKLRLCSFENDFKKVLPMINFDDIIIISDKKLNDLKSIQDTNIEKIESKEINEIKYLLALSNKL